MKIHAKLRWIDNDTAELHSEDFPDSKQYQKAISDISKELKLTESIDLGDHEKLVFKK